MAGKAGKTFTIVKENRVSNSPFTVEGTDMKFDITHEHPIPLETQAFDAKGIPITIRFIMGCNEIDKNKQIAMGYAEDRPPTATERAMTTFLGGMLTVPENYGNLENYMTLAPWFRDVKNRPPNSRIIYELYDQEAIDEDNLEMEGLITDARQTVLKGGRDTLISLLRLSRPGGVIDPNYDVKRARLDLLEIANTNPDFILKNVKAVKNDSLVLISKAVDYAILNLETPGKLLMKSKTNGKLVEIARISDSGGRNSKIERTSAFFESEAGKLVFEEVKRGIKDFEERENLLDDTEKDGEKKQEN